LAGDPIGFNAGVNFYAYVSNDPAEWVDPFGLKEGSPSNIAKRLAIDRIARSYNGSTAWAYDARKDDFAPGTNKCNKFVCDVVRQARAPMLLVPGKSKARCARAGEIGDPRLGLHDWRVLEPGEAPEPGDVAAYPLPGGGAAFSGHSGIITSDGNISAHGDAVYQVPRQFAPEVPTIIYRRYTGE
jgi:hypothetical protein